MVGEYLIFLYQIKYKIEIFTVTSVSCSTNIHLLRQRWN